MIDVSIIIVTWNDKEHLEQCLVSIFKFAGPYSYEIIIVDNASTDGTCEMLAQKFQTVTIISNSENKGISLPRNQGIRASHGKYILFLDSDTELMGAIAPLLREMESDKTIGVIGPKLIHTDGSLQYSCRRFPTPFILFCRFLFGEQNKFVQRYLMMDLDHTKIRQVDWVIFAGVMMRREAVLANGMFNEKYFFYYDDVDFCFRLTQKGFKIMYMPSTIIKHHYQRKSMKKGIKNTFKRLHLTSILRFFCYRYVGFTF